MTSASLRTAALLGLAGLALAACGTNPSGAASVVGSQTVRDADVAAVVDELRDQIGSLSGGSVFDESQATGLTVQRLTRHLILEEIARDKNIVVTQAQVDDLITRSIASSGGTRADLEQGLAVQDNVPSSDVEEYARDFLIRQALGTAVAPGASTDAQAAAVDTLFKQTAERLDVRVAPRFGTWSAFSIGPLPNDLSVPQSTSTGASASPAPSSSASPTG